MSLRNLDHADVWARAVKTAVVAFGSAWALTGNAVSKDAVVAAGAAAGTAVLNYLLQVVKG